MEPVVNVAILESRLIAFLDVLGFSSRMEKESPKAVVEHYSKFIHEADTAVFKPTNLLASGPPVANFAVSRFVFDSVVLVSKPVKDPLNVSSFIFAIGLLMERAFADELPLRGAISLGDYVESTESGIFVSPAFKRLHSMEQQLDWSGCCVLEDAADLVVRSLHGSAIQPSAAQRHHPIVYSAIPLKQITEQAPKLPTWLSWLLPKRMKEQTPRHLWCVNWCHMLTTRDREKGFAYLVGDKQKNTLDFAEFVSKLPGEFPQLVQDHQPDLYVRFVPSTTQCRVRFTDANDEPTEPTTEVTCYFVDRPQSANTHDPSSRTNGI